MTNFGPWNQHADISKTFPTEESLSEDDRSSDSSTKAGKSVKKAKSPFSSTLINLEEKKIKVKQFRQSDEDSLEGKHRNKKIDVKALKDKLIKQK